MPQPTKRQTKQFNLISVIGLVASAVIVAFTVGLLAENTAWGGAISARLQNYFDNRAAGQSGDLPADLNYRSVEELYDRLRSTYDGELHESILLDGLKKGLAEASGDPYTIYLNKDEAEQFSASLNNEFSGIGVEVAIKNNQLQVVAPVEGTPADTAGLRPGDLIFAIDDEDTVGLFVEQAVAKIRGPEGTSVKLTIGRGGTTQEFTITRAQIVIPNARSEILEGNVGYIKLTTFGDKVVDETKAIAADFQGRGIQKIILDLRGNGGGLLDAAVDVAGLWLDSDVVVEQKGKESVSLRSSGRGPFYGLTTVVLVDKGSASASEIVAGALSANGAAQLVGETTFGKGSVQSLEHLPSGGELKVTIARWYTPDGKNIDKEGITPDVEVPLTAEDFDNGRDPQLAKAQELLVAD